MKFLLAMLFVIGNLFAKAQQPETTVKGMDYDSLMKAREEQAKGKKLAAFSAVYKNHVFTNDNLNGKVVFINLWFAACPPCMAEMEALNELYDSLQTKPNFEFISFTYDSPQIIDSIVKLYHIKYKVLAVKQQDCYRLNLNNGFPASIIVDAKGFIKYLKIGGYLENEPVKKSVFSLYYPQLLNEL